MTVKTPAFNPIPIVNVTIVAADRPRVFRRSRIPNRTSSNRPCSMMFITNGVESSFATGSNVLSSVGKFHEHTDYSTTATANEVPS